MEVSLQDLLKNLSTNHAETFDKASRGETPSGAWDGPPLPLNLDYRVAVDSAEYKKSVASGRPQIVLTFEVQEPAEFKGRKFQDYFNPKPDQEVGARKLAELFGALQAKTEGWGEDFEGFVKQFEGRTAVVTVRHWGTDNDRVGIRYINLDKGQELRTNVALAKSRGAKTSTADLRPDINIPKSEGPGETAPAAPSVIPSQTATEAPVTAPPLPGGPNLPPGLS